MSWKVVRIVLAVLYLCSSEVLLASASVVMITRTTDDGAGSIELLPDHEPSEVARKDGSR